MIAFLIVLGFNLYWYHQYGKTNYLNLYKFSVKGGWALFYWAYAIFGVYCLIG